jgi:hypothetical protein
MTEDQCFAASRTDVLVYKTEPLDHDMTISGPITVDLKVSTSGTDSDFDVKLIDVFPAKYPDYDAKPDTSPPNQRTLPANVIQLGGYQELIRGEPFRSAENTGRVSPARFRLSHASLRESSSRCQTYCTRFEQGTESWCRCKAPGSR